jgi:DNA-binding IclR family transcriptional regulator
MKREVHSFPDDRRSAVTRKLREGYSSLSPAVEQAAEILKYLASEPGMKVNLTDISKAVGINKSKTHILLHALEVVGFLSKNERDKSYTLGIDIIPIGQRALENINYRRIAQPFLENLAKETQCTVLFGLIRGKSIVFIGKAISGLAVDSTIGIGDSRALYRRVHGRAILAALPDAEREKLLSGKRFFSDDDVTFIDNKLLRQEIVKVRQSKYATFQGNVHLIQAVASAVLGHDNYPVGVILAVGLLNESQISDCGAKLAEAARNLSIALGMNDDL